MSKQTTNYSLLSNSAFNLICYYTRLSKDDALPIPICTLYPALQQQCSLPKSRRAHRSELLSRPSMVSLRRVGPGGTCEAAHKPGLRGNGWRRYVLALRLAKWRVCHVQPSLAARSIEMARERDRRDRDLEERGRERGGMPYAEYALQEQPGGGGEGRWFPCSRAPSLPLTCRSRLVQPFPS